MSNKKDEQIVLGLDIPKSVSQIPLDPLKNDEITEKREK